MSRYFAFFIVAAVGLLPSISLAQPCPDAEIGFDPGSGVSMDRVTLSASLANPGDEGRLIVVAVTVSFGEQSFGPIESSIYLSAGKELGGEIPFLVRPVFPSGTLTILVEVSAGDCTDSSVASLEIQTDNPTSTQSPDLSALAGSLLQAMSSQPTPVEPTSWGAIKILY